jgi:hypothetical protein
VFEGQGISEAILHLAELCLLTMARKTWQSSCFVLYTVYFQHQKINGLRFVGNRE